MLTQIVAFEHHACLIGEPFGGDAVGRLVDARDAPAVAVAHLIRLAVCTGCGVYGDAGVVVTADDEVADADGLVAGRLCGGAVDSEGVVEARVEGVGHFPGVTYQQRILPGRSVGQVGPQRVGGHRDLIAGVQPMLGAIPAHRPAQPVAVCGAQRQRGVALVGVAHAPHLRKPRRPGQLIAELLEHAAARFHGRQLIGVTHQHRLGARGCGGAPAAAAFNDWHD